MCGRKPTASINHGPFQVNNMGSFSHADYLLMLQRLEENKLRSPTASEPDTEREVGKGGLHEKIMQWCDSQWPPWPYLHNRTDKRSTVAVGACDFLIYCPGGRTLTIECKSATGKQTQDQVIWAKRLEMVGHPVHLVRSMNDFLILTSSI